MKVHEEVLGGVKLLSPTLYEDHRGFFLESYNQDVIDALGIPFRPIQDNHSMSRRVGTLRGLHCQVGHAAQAKLIRVLHGSIYDVVLDVRPSSPTFGKWQAFYLSDEDHFQLFVPKGFAHGFCTMADNTEVFYKVDTVYSPKHERGILWSDPELAITWPSGEKTLSEKDWNLPTFKEFCKALL